jgi:hypothetical protein
MFLSMGGTVKEKARSTPILVTRPQTLPLSTVALKRKELVAPLIPCVWSRFILNRVLWISYTIWLGYSLLSTSRPVEGNDIGKT